MRGTVCPALRSWPTGVLGGSGIVIDNSGRLGAKTIRKVLKNLVANQRFPILAAGGLQHPRGGDGITLIGIKKISRATSAHSGSTRRSPSGRSAGGVPPCASNWFQ